MANKIRTIKEEIRLIGQLKKHHGALSDAQREELGMLRDQLKTMLQLNKKMVDNKEIQRDIVSLSGQMKSSILDNTKSAKLMGRYSREQLDIEESLLKNSKNLGKSAYDILDTTQIETDFAKDKLVIQQKYFGANQKLGKTMIDNTEKRIEYQKSLNDLQQDAHDTIVEANSEFRETFGIDRIKKWSNALRAPGGQLALMKMGVAAIGLSILNWGKNMIDFVKEQGLAYTQMLDIGVAATIGAEETAALLENFGSIEAVTAGTVVNMKMLNKVHNISVESTAQLMKVMEGTSDATKSQLVNQIRVNARLAEAEGVAPGKVMEDIAANTEFFAEFARDGGDNLFRAAIAARKLGLELSAIEDISTSILDFESSIEKEMQAEVLIGREINLERARQLAFSGDQEGAMKAIIEQLGTEADFNRMNVIQRKALAEAVGLSVSQAQRAIAATPVDDISIPAGGATAIAGPAGTFALNKNDSVVAGTNLGGGNKRGGDTAIKELVALTKMMLDQNKALMSKLDRSVRELGAA